MDPTTLPGKPKPSESEEDFVLEDLYETADFEFDLKDVHSDATNSLQQFVARTVIKSALRKHLEKAKNVKEKILSKKDSITQRNLILKQKLKIKKQELEEKFKAPPFVRTQDKAAFTIGIVLLCITEYILLKRPEIMAYWYTGLIFPLLITRYFSYHKLKYHYFMLDFCYYVQVLLLLHIYFIPSPAFFQIIFSLSNGPLCVAIVMWRNSLVFHDLDKLTSVFIHIFPPLVTFSMRWYPIHGHFSEVCVETDCSMSVYYAITIPFVYYVIWQLLYIVKTEVFDKEKLKKDSEIMTSVKWMTEVKPHPIYKMMLKKGLNPHPVVALAGVQGIYTIFTMVPVLFVFNHFELHCLYLAGIFIVCVWNGANFYFEIFSETYSARLKGILKEIDKASNEGQGLKSPKADRKKVKYSDEEIEQDQTTPPTQTAN